MFPQRLQEEEEEEGEVSGLLNLLFLILVSLSWLKTAPVRRYVTIYQVKPRGMAKVVQWKLILPYESKVPVISFLRPLYTGDFCRSNSMQFLSH